MEEDSLVANKLGKETMLWTNLTESGACTICEDLVEEQDLEQTDTTARALYRAAVDSETVRAVLNDSSSIVIPNEGSSEWKVHTLNPRRAFDVQQPDHDDESVRLLSITSNAVATARQSFSERLKELESHGPSTVVVSPGSLSKYNIGRGGTDCQVPHRDTHFSDEGNYCLLTGLVGTHVLWFYPGSHEPRRRGQEGLAFCPGQGAKLKCEILQRQDFGLESIVINPGTLVIFDRRLVHYLGLNTTTQKTYLLQKYVSTAPPEVRIPGKIIVGFSSHETMSK